MVLSPAKLNLGLEIVGRRASDGYHEIQSLFWPITLGDEITVTPAPKVGVKCTWHPDTGETGALPQGQANLVYCALTSIKEPHHVAIRKRIPVGGGLGGGSSNAGTVLRVLGQPGDDLTVTATRLGADVPFFLNPVPSWVTGIGEKRQALTLTPEVKGKTYFLLLLFPFSTITREIFDDFRQQALPFSQRKSGPPSELSFEMLQRYLANTKNDLTPIVASRSPAIAEALSLLKNLGGYYHALSGSGSTCYAIFDSPEAREKGAKGLADFCRIYHCRTVPAETY